MKIKIISSKSLRRLRHLPRRGDGFGENNRSVWLQWLAYDFEDVAVFFVLVLGYKKSRF
jgi:hypothetical protein